MLNMAENYIADIISPLREARRNMMMRRAALVVCWTLAALWAALLLPPALVFPSQLPADWLYVGLLSAGLVFVAGIALAFGDAPALPALARQADEKFGLGERLSAFLDARPATVGPSAAIYMNLARDASLHARKVQPSRLQPLVTRGLVLAFIVQSGFLALAVRNQSLIPAPALQVAEPAAEAGDRETLRENLQAVAEVLREDAEKRQDPYLAAVAEAVKELARNADPGADSLELNKAVEGLLDHARLAYGKSAPLWLRTTANADDRYDLAKDRNLAQLAGKANGSRPVELPNGGGGEELIPETFGERDPNRNNSVVPMKAGEIRTSGDPGEFRLQGQNVPKEGANANAAGEAKAGSMGGSPPTLGEREDADPTDLNGATAVLAGGATQSGAGASRVAGQGTQDLNDPNQPAAAEIAQGPEQVLLPPDQYRQGKRIRMQMNPSKDAVAAGDETAPGLATARRGEPAPVSRDTPSLRDQEMFSRVFVHNEDGGP